MPVCEVCTKEFTPVHGSKTCPGECREKYHRRKRNEYHRAYVLRHKKIFEPVRCPECLKFFTPRREGQVTCSQRCHSDSNLRAGQEAAAISRAIGWTLSVDPFASGLVRDWEGRMPDGAIGF